MLALYTCLDMFAEVSLSEKEADIDLPLYELIPEEAKFGRICKNMFTELEVILLISVFD